MSGISTDHVPADVDTRRSSYDLSGFVQVNNEPRWDGALPSDEWHPGDEPMEDE